MGCGSEGLKGGGGGCVGRRKQDWVGWRKGEMEGGKREELGRERGRKGKLGKGQ